jgi:hypothetical protein
MPDDYAGQQLKNARRRHARGGTRARDNPGRLLKRKTMPHPAPMPPARYATVLRALEGLRNTRAMAVLLRGFLLAGLLFGVGNVLVFSSGSFALAALLNFCGVLIVVAALNTTGLVLMDAASDRPPRDFTASLVEGVLCFGRFMLIAAAAAAGFALYLLGLALLFYLGRIPVLGPLLLVVILPLAVLLTALLMAALFVCLALLAPTLWAGHPVRGALARLTAIARERPLEAIVSLLLLGVLVGAAVLLVSGLLFSAAAQVGLVASGVLGTDLMPAFGMAHGHMDGRGGAGGTGLASAAVIGMSAVFAVVGSAFAAIQLNGLCHIYLQASADIDEARAEGALAGILAATGRVLRRPRDEHPTAAAMRVRREDELAAGPPAGPDTPQAADTAAAVGACPRCRAEIAPTANFCTRCGAPLAR